MSFLSDENYAIDWEAFFSDAELAEMRQSQHPLDNFEDLTGEKERAVPQERTEPDGLSEVEIQSILAELEQPPPPCRYAPSLPPPASSDPLLPTLASASSSTLDPPQAVLARPVARVDSAGEASHLAATAVSPWLLGSSGSPTDGPGQVDVPASTQAVENRATNTVSSLPPGMQLAHAPVAFYMPPPGPYLVQTGAWSHFPVPVPQQLSQQIIAAGGSGLGLGDGYVVPGGRSNKTRVPYTKSSCKINPSFTISQHCSEWPFVHTIVNCDTPEASQRGPSDKGTRKTRVTASTSSGRTSDAAVSSSASGTVASSSGRKRRREFEESNEETSRPGKIPRQPRERRIPFPLPDTADMPTLVPASAGIRQGSPAPPAPPASVASMTACAATIVATPPAHTDEDGYITCTWKQADGSICGAQHQVEELWGHMRMQHDMAGLGKPQSAPQVERCGWDKCEEEGLHDALFKHWTDTHKKEVADEVRKAGAGFNPVVKCKICPPTPTEGKGAGWVKKEALTRHVITTHWMTATDLMHWCDICQAFRRKERGGGIAGHRRTCLMRLMKLNSNFKRV
ncbi:hypothetical protein DAEQUDRAFT_813308 [Daedalea quercina L-15889]|uniref:Uncharacterized protein n=1 Tax=Daedalea quercina L-15889 TaxID=1314783 RepID=A0A165NAN1_9APHY|nr:hypothetical protein DAEQUDRAFT_813308 [Daedalea quercina L-15889]